jgi:hypothetical protein
MGTEGQTLGSVEEVTRAHKAHLVLMTLSRLHVWI